MRLKSFFIFILFISFFLDCATANRSTRGLKPRQINVSYIPPFAGALRIGISSNIETRFSWWFERPVVDIFIHSNNDSSFINFGWAGGAILKFFPNSEGPNVYFSSVTLGMHYKKRLFPYLTYSYFSNLINSKNNDYQIALGCETVIYRFNKSRHEIIITPEIIWAPAFDTYPFNTKFLGTIGLGFTFGAP